MLEKVDLTKKISKEEYKGKMPQLEARLGRLQRECKALGIPVLIVFEGFGAAGKGLQIGYLIQSMDPRGFEVHPIKNETEEERMHPFMWRFWTKTPARGRIAVYDGCSSTGLKSGQKAKIFPPHFTRSIRLNSSLRKPGT
mgnify:CR=1 FL=1